MWQWWKNPSANAGDTIDMGSAPGWERSSGGGCCSTVTKSCPTLCDPENCSTPGFSVLHYLPELAPTHVHWVSDAIQPSHLLSPPSPLVLNLSQHQGFSNKSALCITWPLSGASASILPINIQGWFPLGVTGFIS